MLCRFLARLRNYGRKEKAFLSARFHVARLSILKIPFDGMEPKRQGTNELKDFSFSYIEKFL